MANIFDQPKKNNIFDSYKPTTPSPKSGDLVKSPSGVLNNITQAGLGFIKGAGRSLINFGNFAKDVVYSPLTATGHKLPKIVQQTEMPKSFEATNTAQKVGGYIETAAEVAGPVVLSKAAASKSLFKMAQKLYQSALKPSTTLSEVERAKIVKTGLDEGIRLTKGGIEKTAGLIDTLENKLGKAIDDAAGIIRDETGKVVNKTGNIAKISTETLKPYIDDVKKFFENTADVNYSKTAIKKLNTMYENLVEKYGKNIDVDVAQEIKTNTYRLIKNYFDKLSAPAIEGSKQIARGIKEGIVKVAPITGDINARLAKLYNFENALEKASGRIGNLNVISLGSKVLAGFGGKTGAVLAAFNEVLGKAGVKSIAAIGMDRVAKVLSKLSPEDASILYKALKGGVAATGANIEQGIKSIFKDTTK